MTDSDSTGDIASIERKIADLERHLATDEIDAAQEALRLAETAFRRATHENTDETDSLRDTYMTALADYNRVFSDHQHVFTEDWYRRQRELRRLVAERARIRGDLYNQRIVFGPGEVDGCELDREFAIQPDLSGSGELFIQSEFGQPFVVFGASATNPDGQERLGSLDTVAILFTRANPLPLWGVTQARFGHPNEEAHQAPEVFGPGFEGIGLYRVINSDWQDQIVQSNRYQFPWTPVDIGLTHFRFAFKENSLEVAAAGIQAWSGLGSWEGALELYRSQARNWPE